MKVDFIFESSSMNQDSMTYHCDSEFRYMLDMRYRVRSGERGEGGECGEGSKG